MEQAPQEQASGGQSGVQRGSGGSGGHTESNGPGGQGAGPNGSGGTGASGGTSETGASGGAGGQMPGGFTIGGTVSGLRGSGLVLQNNLGDDLPITGDGGFAFPTPLLHGSSFSITILAQPSNPNQLCTVSDGEGILEGFDVTDVAVTCLSFVAIEEFSTPARLVSSGDTVTLAWATSDATSCAIAPGDVEASPADMGSVDVTVHEATLFTLTCEGLGGPVNQTVDVLVTDEDWVWVTPGQSHTCALKNDNRLFCWGHGSYGQLGNQLPSQFRVPVQEVTQATDWAQISAGRLHTCAVKSDGRLFCWGRGAWGQLGNDSMDDSLVPVQEDSEATDWAQVSAGYDHTCAVKSDGRLFCWGRGSAGQLGNLSDALPRVPIQEFTEATDWAQVSTGQYHTCAVKNDGRLFCWGQVFGGSYVPIQEPSPATDWKQVAAGHAFTCAVKNDGRLFCWGRGAWGQLGNDSTDDSPVPVQENSEAIDWVQVSAGAGHACAVKNDGRLFCWGSDVSGRLGNGSMGDRYVPTQVFSEATDWAQVSLGQHTCAAKTDGRLFCWGNNSNAQLGNDSTMASPVPVPVFPAAE